MRRILPPQLLAAGLLAFTAARADGPIEEVLVTAELRETGLLEQAASTSVVDGERIRLRAAQHLQDILGLMPNVNFSGGSSRARFYQVRGVGERSQFVEPLNPSIGLLVDDIDLSGLGTAGSLFDIEQVEVLRGPQGTLHGANALAGLINIRSAAPEPERSTYVDASLGNYGARSLGAMLNAPVTENLALRLAVNGYRDDGFLDNAYLRSDRTNARDERVARGRLRWQSDSDLIDLVLLHTDVDNGYDAFSLDNTRTTLSDQPGHDRIELDAAGLNWQRELPSIRVELLANAANSATDYDYDEDWSYAGIAPGWEYSSTDAYLRERQSRSLQLRLVSREPLTLAGLTADWAAGMYRLDEDESLRRRYTYLAEDFTSRYATGTSALFGQLDIALTDRLDLATGLRLEHRSTDYADNNGVAEDPAKTLWGGRLAIEFSRRSGQLFYASLSRGYRANGVNAGILSAPDLGGASCASLCLYDEELLYNWELGFKSLGLGGRLQNRLAVFFMDRVDQQVKGSLVVPREDGSTAFIDYTDNAATGSNAGLEWELDWQATRQLQLFGSLGLLRARFDRYVNADGVDLAGRDQAHAPAYQFAGGAQFDWDNGWSLRAEAEGKDGFYFSDRHDVRARAYALLHLRLGYTTSRWSAALWVRNLAGRDYFIRGFGGFGNDPRKEYVVEPYYQYGDPRLFGASVRVHF